ncbi:SDR family NAD(P)-dependent oxidoreductase [Croceicoccus sp. YJ47]|uniref:SDR family NAD(P)-dependent oxidoreductase n=1 Tax=Croceicoccus sp. YJ47 TaxID=2798724 RepID=UPI00192385C4|nr:SDR family oxidoreductase [Croceicoccus sp. YJ47]QQN73415.1 SDR family oxidoreductase [Croceicoccus sp. YJ47]
MSISLPDCVVVITGATGGIGRETVTALKDAGATVIATDLADTAPDLGADHYVRHDVTEPDDWAAVADLVSREYGLLDALVNNAGISIVTKFEDTDLSQFHRVNAVNVDGIVIGIQALLPLLKQGGQHRDSGASIINFSSVGGLRGAPFNAAYCTSKAAVAMLTKCLGAEFSALGYNIRVNSVHPGGVDTGMLSSIMERYVEMGAAGLKEEAHKSVVASHPIGRLARPGEMAGGVVYLASDAASFVTCAEFVIDGGFTQT